MSILIDTHAHYTHKKFDCGRDDILKGLHNENVAAVIEGAIDYDSNFKMSDLCRKYPFVYMAAGCHPNCVEVMDEEKFQTISDMLHLDKVIAVGETGLDYSHEKSGEQIELQKKWFLRFLKLALEKQKPVVIHCRGKEAYDDMIALLSENSMSENPGVVHCFSGDREQAKKLIDMGFYLGITGKFTRYEPESELCQALRSVSLGSIVLETDAPFLMPVGLEGQRNTSLNLRYIAGKLAQLRGEDPAFLCDVILENTKRLYPQVIEHIEDLA